MRRLLQRDEASITPPPRGRRVPAPLEQRREWNSCTAELPAAYIAAGNRHQYRTATDMQRAINVLSIAAWLALALPVAVMKHPRRSWRRRRSNGRTRCRPRASTPARFPSPGPAGDLLRQERFAGYTLIEGVRAVRILYHSLDAVRGDVVTSAVVLIPPGAAPQGGWPVIAWAHGTSGVAPQCAPSLMRDVYYGAPVLAAMLKGGFAVVATDYHGLGTPGPSQYGSKQAQAFDVIYAMPAARTAVPELGRRWVVDGHSQGGFTAWGVAELESKLKDDGYLGAISVAGAFR